MRYAVAVAAAASVLLSGCVQLGRVARVSPARIAARTPPENCEYISGVGKDFKFAIDLDCFRFQNPNKVSVYPEYFNGDPKLITESDEVKYTAYSLARGNKDYRNRLEAILLSQADANCEKEKGHIFANEAGLGFALNTLASTFDTAATIVTGEPAKSILAGAAGLSTATKSHLTANVYKNQIVPAITNVMDAERTKILNALIGLRDSSVDKYNVDDMIRRVNNYNQACSFQFGVQALLKASENKAGTDALIHGINIDHEIARIRRALPLVTDPAKRARLEDKIVEMTLERAQTTQSAQGEANTVTDASPSSDALAPPTATPPQPSPSPKP